MAEERRIATYPPAFKGSGDQKRLQQEVDAWSRQMQQWLSQEISKILGQAIDHGGRIVALENVGKIKARAYRNAAQNIDATKWTKVAIDTISRDTEGVVDIVNGRITPNLPGDYIVFGNVRINDIPDSVSSGVGIYKNGNLVSYGPSTRPGAEADTSWSVPDHIYMNGTTDYLELYAYNGHSSALALTVGYSYMNYISILGPF